jgi:hypothetical protein
MLSHLCERVYIWY